MQRLLVLIVLVKLQIESGGAADSATATVTVPDSEATVEEANRSDEQILRVNHLRTWEERSSTGTMSETVYSWAEGPLKQYGCYGPRVLLVFHVTLDNGTCFYVVYSLYSHSRYSRRKDS